MSERTHSCLWKRGHCQRERLERLERERESDAHMVNCGHALRISCGVRPFSVSTSVQRVNPLISPWSEGSARQRGGVSRRRRRSSRWKS